MERDKISIEDVEIDDIIFINNQHGYCSVKDISFNLNCEVVLTLEHVLLHKGERLFTKAYKFTKKFMVYE